MRMLESILQNKRAILLIVLLIALFPRFLLLQKSIRGGLGVDELQSAIHAYLPIDQLLKSVQAYDPHPPLFYIQLHFWEKFGTSDGWLRMNTILWIMLTILSLWMLGEKVFDFKVGFFASILFALSPIAVAYSISLRMYAFLIFLAVWVWYSTHQFFRSKHRWVSGAGIFLSTLAFLYSQGAGFLILPSGIVYAILIGLKSWRKNFGLFVKYLILQGIIIVLYIPWLIRARTIHLAHTVAPGFSDVSETLAQLLFGPTIILSSYFNVVAILTTVIFSLVLIIFLFHESSRAIGISFVFTPLVTCFVISHLLEPIWLTRSLVQVTPFISLGLALVIWDWIRDRQLVPIHRTKNLFEMSLVGAIVIGSVGGLAHLQSPASIWSPLKESASLIRDQFEPLDVVYLPNVRMYWGWSWYFFGPGRVAPLTTNYLVSQDGITAVSKPTVSAINEGEHQVWLVYSSIDNLGNAIPSEINFSPPISMWKFDNVTVVKYYTSSKVEP